VPEPSGPEALAGGDDLALALVREPEHDEAGEEGNAEHLQGEGDRGDACSRERRSTTPAMASTPTADSRAASRRTRCV
jgi:hypothetical protein